MLKYRSEIDGLRAFAVLPVIFYHLGSSAVPGGFLGVDVFFVISGYLITKLIIDDIQMNSFSIASFYERRARRILPALTLTLVLSCIAAVFLLAPESLSSFGKVLVGVSTFTSNMVIMLDTGYFAQSAELQPLLHTWSLSVEEQFYIFFPIFLMLVYHFNKKRLLPLLFLGTFSSFILAIWGAENARNFSFFLLPTRAWELGVGAILAILYVDNMDEKRSKGLYELGSIIGMAIIIASFFYMDHATFLPALLPTIGTALVIYFARTGSYLSRFLSLRPFVVMGLLSYSAYLFHQPILVFTALYFGDGLKSVPDVLLVLIIFAAAHVSWKYAESPFRDRSFLTRKQILIASILTLSVFFTSGLVLWKSNGFISEYPEYQRLTKLSAWPESYNADSLCKEKYGGDQYCLIANITLPPTALLIGDSHANHFYHGLADTLTRQGSNLLMVGVGGCPPILDIDMGYHYLHGQTLDCYSKTNLLYKNLVEKYPFEEIYLSFAHQGLFDERLSFTDQLGSFTYEKGSPLFFKNTLSRTIQYFTDRGSKVVLIEDLPDVSYNKLTNCAMAATDLSQCLDTLRLEPVNDKYYRLLKDLKLLNDVRILKTSGALNTFPLTTNGGFMYRDNTHLTKAGSIDIINRAEY